MTKLLIALLFISTASTAQKKDSVWYTAKEDTIWHITKGFFAIQVTHTDWEHHSKMPKIGVSNHDGIVGYIYGEDSIKWHRFTKVFEHTDTGWRRVK